VYYDETNRASFVNTSKKVNESNTGTEVYSPFYSEKSVPQSYFNHVNWKIYHKPPVWATHYQWVYSGNTSVDEFIQIPIENAYKGLSENIIYLSLGALKGGDLSYDEENSSLIDYNFVEGDRVRFISFGGDPDGSESERKYFKDYIDVPISSAGIFDEADLVELTYQTDPAVVIPGHYIVIKNPHNSIDSNFVKYSISNEPSSSYSDVDIRYTSLDHTDPPNGYHKLVVEIYRPKKIVEGESSGVYYEVGDKMNIEGPGTVSRTHQGQISNYFFDSESGLEVTAKDSSLGPVDVNGDPTSNYSSGFLKTGDTYTKVRRISHWRENQAGTPVKTSLNCESYYLSDFFQSNNWSQGRMNIENPYSEERRLPTSVYYSDFFSSTTNYNGLSTFDLSVVPYHDYNQDFGSIQHLMLRGDDLIIFHENKVGRVLIGKNILNYADGDSNLAVSSEVLSDYAQVYSGNNGCSLNPESIVKYKDRFYFVDIKRGAILRLGGDGLTRISDYGLSTYLRDKGEAYVNFNPEESTEGEFKIIAGYDPKYDEYVVTLPSITNLTNSTESGLWGSESLNWEKSFPLIKDSISSNAESYATISYNDNLKKWTSFYTYLPEFYSKINRQFVTFKNGHLYRQNSSNANFNTFYGERFSSTIDFPFNSEVSSVKSYNAISLESDTKLLTKLFTNMGQYNNNYNYNVSTIIGFRKVSGEISVNGAEAQLSIINGSEDSDFYKDLALGDLIRVYGSMDSNSPEYRSVVEIISKTKIRVDSSLSNPFQGARLEVIDYKTKEGTQYSQIPFVPSKLNSYEGTEFEGNYEGDASNVFGLGVLDNNTEGNTGILRIFHLKVIKLSTLLRLFLELIILLYYLEEGLVIKKLLGKLLALDCKKVLYLSLSQDLATLAIGL
jgi:hypothetical protein